MKRSSLAVLSLGTLLGCSGGPTPSPPSDYALYSVALEALADSGRVPMFIRRTASLTSFGRASPEFVYDSLMAEHPSPLADLLGIGRSRLQEAPVLYDSFDISSEYSFLGDDVESRFEAASPSEARVLADSLFPGDSTFVCLAPPAWSGDLALVVLSDLCWDDGAFHGLYYVLERDGAVWRIRDEWGAWIN